MTKELPDSKIIKLNQQLKRIEIKGFEVDNPIVFEFFNSIPAGERTEKFLKAIYVGVLALKEDRLAAFLAKTANELGTELESLKVIFDMKKELFFKSNVKGIAAENDVAEFLNQYFKEKGISDQAIPTGNTTGTLPKNKTGDILCTVGDNENVRIAVECKFDKSIKLGDIVDKNLATKKADTAWSQLLEASVNRDAKASIIVFDISLIDSSIINVYDNIGYIPEVGFIVIINSQAGDYRNLAIAYSLTRDIVTKAKNVEFDKDTFCLLISRLVKDLNEVFKIRDLVETNIYNNNEILKSINKNVVSMEFSLQYFQKFLKDGKLTRKDLFDFYSGHLISQQLRVEEYFYEIKKVI